MTRRFVPGSRTQRRTMLQRPPMEIFDHHRTRLADRARGVRLARLEPETQAGAGGILPTFCSTDLYRAARTRITLNSQSADGPADQGEGD
jgi:hypothetical protein